MDELSAGNILNIVENASFWKSVNLLHYTWKT